MQQSRLTAVINIILSSSKVAKPLCNCSTSKKLSLGQMSDDEKKLYDMIARSVICICYPKAQLSKTNIITEKSGEEFTTCGISILKPGILKYWEDQEKIYCLNYRKGSLYRENI